MALLLEPEAKTWRSLLNAINSIVEEADFNFSQEGLKIRSMDPSHVAMIDLYLPKDFFDEYESETVKICLNIENLLKMPRRIEAGESLEAFYDEGKAEFILTLRKSYTRIFSLKTIDAGEEEKLPTPKIDFEASIKITTDALKNALEDIAAVKGDEVRIHASQNSLKILSKGITSGNFMFEASADSEVILGFDLKNECKAVFSYSYLSEIIGNAFSDLVTLYLGSNIPLKLSFLLSQGMLEYYIAPRIMESE